jgi:cytosine/adenosine deaminase-related metal-dependent hydrolase
MNTDDAVNLWQVAKTAALLHTLATPDYRRWPQPDEVLEALWRGGARAMRREGELGQLRVGAQADIALLDLDTPAYTPLNDLPRQLVHCEDGGSVRATIVAGRVVFEDGRISTVDEPALRAEMRALVAASAAQTERAAREAARLEPYYRDVVLRCAAEDVGMNRWLS